MRERLYYFFTSKIFIISIIVIASLGVIGVGIWGGMKIFEKEEEKIYYKVQILFVDENEAFVEGVKINNGNTTIYTTDSNGIYNDKYVEKGTVLTFQKEGYQIQIDKVVVDSNILLLQINLISNESLKKKTFTTKVIDVNGIPMANVNVYEGNKRLGSTDSKGEFQIVLLEGTKSLNFKYTGNYFTFPNVQINYDDDVNAVKEVISEFLIDKYINYVDSEGNPQTRTFTTGYTFRTKDGRILNNVQINYKLKNEAIFRYKSGYSIVFENQVYETLFAYAYDTTNSTWICSQILQTSPLGGNIYMDEAIHISAKVDTSRGTVFTSSGYYFLADNDKNIELVIRSFEGESFYKELEYGIPKYELLLYDENNNLVTDVIHSVSNCVFKLK